MRLSQENTPHRRGFSGADRREHADGRDAASLRLPQRAPELEARTTPVAFTPPTARAAIQDEERRRLAREIHDCLGHQVTALRLSLDALAAEGAANPQYASYIAKAQQLAQALDRSIDALTQQLRPAALDILDLPAALSRLVGDWSEQTGIPAECYVSGPASNQLDLHAASHLYRLVQEALHNVVKHARATYVNVSYVCRDGDYVLLVEDNGRGFDVSQVMRASQASRGFGLTSMRERAALAGGELEVESSPVHGTTIVVRIPVRSWSAVRQTS